MRKKSRRRKNIKIQLHNKINSLLRIGESKHEAKKEYRKVCESRGIKWNPSKTPYIHSIVTADNYRDTVNKFSSWLKEERPEVWSTKDLDSITKDVCYDFLKEVDSESSAWTTSRHMAALNKTLDHDLNKSEGGLKQRSYKNITRSRLDREHDSSYNPDNYEEQIDFAKAFGLRRESISEGDYAVKEMSLFKEDDTIYCVAIEKGGKYREARCLEEYEEIIGNRYKIDERSFYDKETYIEKYEEDNDDVLFDNYTKKIDNHAFRREYAQKLYYELKEEKEGYFVKEDYRGYNREIVLEVSKSLGHEREDIVIEYYLN